VISHQVIERFNEDGKVVLSQNIVIFSYSLMNLRPQCEDFDRRKVVLFFTKKFNKTRQDEIRERVGSDFGQKFVHLPQDFLGFEKSERKKTLGQGILKGDITVPLTCLTGLD
jgi:hypothetical protein